MTMIERIAQTVRAELSPMGGDIVSGGLMPDDEVNDIVRAVLRELQNPTDAMAEAGAKSGYDLVLDVDEHGARTIFSAMIDAALVDGA